MLLYFGFQSEYSIRHTYIGLITRFNSHIVKMMTFYSKNFSSKLFLSVKNRAILKGEKIFSYSKTTNAFYCSSQMRSNVKKDGDSNEKDVWSTIYKTSSKGKQEHRLNLLDLIFKHSSNYCFICSY